MQAIRIFVVINFLLLQLLSLTSCGRNSGEVWEDSKSAGRHMSRGVRTLGGKHGDSRAVQDRQDFMPAEMGYYEDSGYYADNEAAPVEEFVPLSDQINNQDVAMGDFVSRQPRETPGDPGSSIPGINAFQDPNINPAWGGVFRNITFDYNSNLVKGQENLDTVHRVADYMRRNNNTYIFIEGHCDERGPEAYNLALGVRRSNSIRNMLIQEGVSPDNIFTISYGKERPLFYDHNEGAWSQNRRAEFKIYQR
jgi:peptidoglycan-associated lipoprotein